MAERDDDAADPYGALRRPKAVAKPTAGQRHQVNRRRVESVNRRGDLSVSPMPPLAIVSTMNNTSNARIP